MELLSFNASQGGFNLPQKTTDGPRKAPNTIQLSLQHSSKTSTISPV